MNSDAKDELYSDLGTPIISDDKVTIVEEELVNSSKYSEFAVGNEDIPFEEIVSQKSGAKEEVIENPMDIQDIKDIETTQMKTTMSFNNLVALEEQDESFKMIHTEKKQSFSIYDDIKAIPGAIPDNVIHNIYSPNKYKMVAHLGLSDEEAEITDRVSNF